MSEKEVQMKECSRCKESKPANNEHFCNSKTNYDRLFSWCKICQRENRVKRRRMPANEIAASHVIDKGELLTAEEVDAGIESWANKDPKFALFWENESVFNQSNAPKHLTEDVNNKRSEV